MQEWLSRLENSTRVKMFIYDLYIFSVFVFVLSKQKKISLLKLFYLNKFVWFWQLLSALYSLKWVMVCF